MRVPSGKTDQSIYFVALDSSDRVTRKTGLSSFTVYRSRNGGAATVYTTPTIAELSSSNMPGVYSLTIDEDTTIGSTSDSEEYCVHITATNMAPVTRTIELYRRDVTTGNTIGVASNGHVSNVDTLTTYTGNTVQTGDAFARIGAAGAGLTALGDTRIAHLDVDVSTRLAASSYTAPDNATITAIAGYIDTEVAAIKAKTDNLPASPAATGDIPASDITAIKAVTDALPTFVHTAGKLWVLDGDGNAVAPSSQTQAIQTKTDSLTFSKTDELDVNIKSVADASVTGTGTPSDPWGP